MIGKALGWLALRDYPEAARTNLRIGYIVTLSAGPIMAHSSNGFGSDSSR